MPGDPTVARLTLRYHTRPETHHRRVSFFSARFLPSTQPAAPDESTHAASCIAVGMLFGPLSLQEVRPCPHGLWFPPAPPGCRSGRACGRWYPSVITIRAIVIPTSRSPRPSPDNAPPSFSDLPVKIVHREQGIPPRPGKAGTDRPMFDEMKLTRCRHSEGP